MDNSFNPFHVPDDDKDQLVRPGYTTTVIKPPTVQTDVIDDYAPFQNQPAIIKAESTSKPQSSVNVEHLQKMEKDLEDRTRRLAEEEKRLRAPESQASLNNFPPIPNFCPIKPCFYQAIDVEIPEQYRPIVRLSFALWLAYSATLFLNMFGTLAYMILRKQADDTGPFFGISIVYFLLFTPLTYILWFRPLYKAFKNNSSFNFFLFFLMFAIQIVILIIQVLGIRLLGSCGWIVSIVASSYSIGVMVFMLIIATAFSVELACSIFIMIRVNLYFRTSGASMDKAKEELGREAASSSTVRNAAAGMMSSR